MFDGRTVAIKSLQRSDYADTAFWFAPESQRLGVVIETHKDRLSRSFSAAICLKDDMANAYASGQFLDWQTIEPTPPIANIERVSGKGATAYNYYNNGLSDYLRFRKVATENGIDLSSPETSVLDWGCGCGRLTRQFLDLTPCSVTGADIDKENVEWCKANLTSGTFETIGLYPPTKFANGSFDLIIANSVLSHLKIDAMHAWLDEVARLLKPTGVALLSYHGNFSLAAVLSKSIDFAKRVYGEGFNSDMPAKELEGFISDPAYYRQTFMNDERATEIFRGHLRLSGVKIGMVSRYQNVAILKS